MAAEGAIESSTPIPGSFSGIKDSRTNLMVSWKGRKKQLYLVGGFYSPTNLTQATGGIGSSRLSARSIPKTALGVLLKPTAWAPTSHAAQRCLF